MAHGESGAEQAGLLTWEPRVCVMRRIVDPHKQGGEGVVKVASSSSWRDVQRRPGSCGAVSCAVRHCCCRCGHCVCSGERSSTQASARPETHDTECGTHRLVHGRQLDSLAGIWTGAGIPIPIHKALHVGLRHGAEKSDPPTPIFRTWTHAKHEGSKF